MRLVRALVRRLAGAVIANSARHPGDARRPRSGGELGDPGVGRAVAPARARPDAQTTFGMLGRIAPWKGQDLFLRAFAEAFPDGE